MMRKTDTAKVIDIAFNGEAGESVVNMDAD